MEVKLLDERAGVYEESNTMSKIIGELRLGDEFTLGKAVKTGGTEWVAATMSDGAKGYVLGNIKVYSIREVFLHQKNVNILKAPALDAKVKMICKKGDKFTLSNLVTVGGIDWVEVRVESGEVGFIPAETRIKDITSDQMFKEKDYKAFMVGIFLIGGLIGIPFTYGIGGGIGYFESLPWSFVSCMVFLIAFRRNGTISWGRAVPAIIGVMLLAKAYTGGSGKTSFAAGGVFGFLLVIVCGYAGIGIDRLLNRKEQQ